MAAGEVRHSIAFTFSAAVMVSPRMPGGDPLMPKYAMKPGWFQWVSPGTSTRSTSARIASSDSPCAGGCAGRAAAMSPGSTRAITGSRSTPSR